MANRTHVFEARLDPDLGILVQVPARRIAGGLRVLAVREQPQHQLDVPLGLHVAAHHAEGCCWLAGAAHEARHDRVVGTLATANAVGVARISETPSARFCSAMPVPAPRRPSRSRDSSTG